MLKEKKMSKKKSTMLSLVMIVIIGIIGYLIYSNFFASKNLNTSGGQAPVDVVLLPGLNTTIANDFFDRKPYTGLTENGRLPVSPGPVGRINPFSEVLFGSSR